MKFNCKSIFPVFVCFFLFIPHIFCKDKKNIPDSVYGILWLSYELNNLDMFEESIQLLNREMEKDPSNKALYLVQKAATYYDKKEILKADAIIKSIDKTSEVFPFSQFVVGINLVRHKKEKEAIPYFESYIKYIKENPPQKKEKFKRKQFERAVSYLIYLYKKNGAMDKLKNWTGN